MVVKNATAVGNYAVNVPTHKQPVLIAVNARLAAAVQWGQIAKNNSPAPS